jgi:hypothetical protein
MRKWNCVQYVQTGGRENSMNALRAYRIEVLQKVEQLKYSMEESAVSVCGPFPIVSLCNSVPK